MSCGVDAGAWGKILGDGGPSAGVVGPPPGELFSETNDNSVAILLTYEMARPGRLIVINVRNYKTF
jgi:hypothetical protein